MLACSKEQIRYQNQGRTKQRNCRLSPQSHKYQLGWAVWATSRLMIFVYALKNLPTYPVTLHQGYILFTYLSPNVSTTPFRQWGFRQCLPFRWTTLRGKNCRHPIAVMGVVDTFGHKELVWGSSTLFFPDQNRESHSKQLISKD